MTTPTNRGKEATCKPFLNTYRSQGDLRSSVSIRVTHNRIKRYYPISIDGEKLALSQKEFERVISARKRSKQEDTWHKAITEKLGEASRIISELEQLFTFYRFENDYLKNQGAVNTVYGGFERYIKDLRAEGRIGTAITYECAQKSIENFNPGLSYLDITPRLLENYKKWMQESGNSLTTVGIYLRSLRAVYNSQPNIDRSLYPFGKNKKKFVIPKGRNIKKALTLAEVAKIFQFTPETEVESKARDYWTFIYLVNGLNVKDLCRLKWSNINGETLTFLRAKTAASSSEPKPIKVSLKEESKAIMARWGVKTIDPSGFIFPHLNLDTTPEQERKIIQQVTKDINKTMKRIAVKLGIEKPVTTYCARHSFATIMKKSGASIEMIMELLGHQSGSTTQNYLDSFEDEQIHTATNVLTQFA